MTQTIQKTKFWNYLNGGFLYGAHEVRLRKALKILISVVIGALLLAGLYMLFEDTILPTLTQRIVDLFDYNG